MTIPQTPSPNSPSQLIAALSALAKEHPAYASFVKTARAAVIGTLSNEGEHGMILHAIEQGCNTYGDLREETGFSSGYLHKNLKQLIVAGLVRVEDEGKRGNFRPRKLFFLTDTKGVR